MRAVSCASQTILLERSREGLGVEVRLAEGRGGWILSPEKLEKGEEVDLREAEGRGTTRVWRRAAMAEGNWGKRILS